MDYTRAKLYLFSMAQVARINGEMLTGEARIANETALVMADAIDAVIKKCAELELEILDLTSNTHTSPSGCE